MMWPMRLSQVFANRDKTLSYEFFPPKTPRGETSLARTLELLAPLKPDFISVTYGAGGSTRGRTGELVSQIQEQYQIPTMAHLTTVNATKSEIAGLLDEYHNMGIDNILGLRGDPPEGDERYAPTDGGYAYASELLQALKEDGRFDTACAAYPDGHVQNPSVSNDWDRFCDKIDAGALAGITQCFFQVQPYLDMLAHCTQRHADVRIIPGVIPVTNFTQLDNFCSRCGAIIPDSMRARFEPIADDKERMIEDGMQFTIDLCRELLKAGAPGLHIYTLNKATYTRQLTEVLRDEGLL